MSGRKISVISISMTCLALQTRLLLACMAWLSQKLSFCSVSSLPASSPALLHSNKAACALSTFSYYKTLLICMHAFCIISIQATLPCTHHSSISPAPPHLPAPSTPSIVCVMHWPCLPTALTCLHAQIHGGKHLPHAHTAHAHLHPSASTGDTTTHGSGELLTV